MFSVSGPGMKGMVGMAARVFAAMSPRPYFRGADYAIIFRIQYQFLRSAKRLCAG